MTDIRNYDSRVVRYELVDTEGSVLTHGDSPEAVIAGYRLHLVELAETRRELERVGGQVPERRRRAPIAGVRQVITHTVTTVEIGDLMTIPDEGHPAKWGDADD